MQGAQYLLREEDDRAELSLLDSELELELEDSDLSELTMEEARAELSEEDREDLEDSTLRWVHACRASAKQRVRSCQQVEQEKANILGDSRLQG